MWRLVAPYAADLPEQQSNGQLPVLIFGLLGTVVVVVGTVLVALINSRANRTTASPPAPTPVGALGDQDGRAGERIAVLEHRAEDSDERDEMQDRRLNAIEAHLDMRGETWR